MLEAPELQALAKKIVLARLPLVGLDKVLTTDVMSSDGEDALRITLVLTPESVDALTGSDALKILLDIRDGFEREGEKRFPIVEYATADDLAEADDDEA